MSASRVSLVLWVAFLASAFAVGCSCSDTGGNVAKDLALSVDPGTIDFGTVPILGTKAITVTVRHSGTGGVVHLDSLDLEVDSDEITLEQPETYSLAVGEETTFTVRYSPQNSTVDGGYVVIKHDVAQQNYETRIPITANGQVADLIADPNPIDFGQVKAGAFLDKDVLLKNVGSDNVQIDRIYLKPDGSDDIVMLAVVLPEGQSLPQTIAPGASLGLVLRYEPTGGGADSTLLFVDATTRGMETQWFFNVRGSELGPKIVVLPGDIQFGGVGLDQVETRLLSVRNEGNDDLVLKGGWFKLQPGADEGLSLPDAPAEDVTIPAGEARDYHVNWDPVKPRADDGQAIGSLSIESNAPGSPTMVPIHGRVDAPLISVIPETVDFGFGAKGLAVTRTLTIRNDGYGKLTVSKLEFGPQAIPGEFVLVNDSQLASDLLAGNPVQIDGQMSVGLTLSFTNKGAGLGSVSGTLAITSDAEPSPLTVNLVAQRADVPECKVTLVPQFFTFGVVPQGFYKDFTFSLKNTGTGACSFKSAKIVDCTVMPGFNMTQCPDPTAATSGKSTVFTFLGLPPVVANGIAPGAAVPLTVRYKPSSGSSMFGELVDYKAVMALNIYDSLNKKDISLPSCPLGLGGVPQCKENLYGQSGLVKVSVMPGEVKFGLTTIGCYSKTYKVCVYNTGNAPLKVSEIAFQGCTPEFKKKNVPSLPKDVSAGAPLCFETVYAPQDVGDDTCVMQIKSNDQSSSTLMVGLSGSGTLDSEQTDEFIQVSGQAVDILFIIDDSGSMCNKQERLTNAYASFIQNAEVWDNDYHIGFIDVNVLDEALMGKLNRGNPNPPARFLTPTTPDQANKFVSMATFGCDGTAPWGTGGGFSGKLSDEQEAGLDAAQMALSAPLTTETGAACKTTTDCKNNKNICSDAATCPYICADGTCGGWNKGFLRQDAQLELVVLQDEEDQSSAALSFYVDFLKNIKGFYNTNMMHFNSIVGVNDGSGGTGGAACVGPDGAAAAEGKRFIEVSTQTNGKVGSICDPDYSPVMNQIGKVAFGLKVQFFLTRLADPGTVKVWVNDVTCASPAGWKYDAPSNSVIFDELGACMPQPGDTIKVYYKTLCLTS